MASALEGNRERMDLGVVPALEARRVQHVAGLIWRVKTGCNPAAT